MVHLAIIDSTIDRIPPDLEWQRFEAVLAREELTLHDLTTSSYQTSPLLGDMTRRGYIDEASRRLAQSRGNDRALLVIISTMSPAAWQELWRVIDHSKNVRIHHYHVDELA